MSNKIDAKALREKIESMYAGLDLTQDDKELLRRERHSLLVKGLPRPDNAERVQKPEIKEKISETLKEFHADPNNKEKLEKAQEKRHASMDWEKHREHNARINSDPDIVAKKLANHKQWQNSEPGKMAYFQGRAKIRKPLIDDQGREWASAQEAAPVCFPDKTLERAVKTIRYLIKNNLNSSSGWRYKNK
jgi:hypothetical protein